MVLPWAGILQPTVLSHQGIPHRMVVLTPPGFFSQGEHSTPGSAETRAQKPKYVPQRLLLDTHSITCHFLWAQKTLSTPGWGKDMQGCQVPHWFFFVCVSSPSQLLSAGARVWMQLWFPFQIFVIGSNNYSGVCTKTVSRSGGRRDGQNAAVVAGVSPVPNHTDWCRRGQELSSGFTHRPWHRTACLLHF